jgi:hypothetical protein
MNICFPELFESRKTWQIKMVGTTRARVSKFMNAFKKKGFVSYNGGGLQINSALISAFLQNRPMSIVRRA